MSCLTLGNPNPRQGVWPALGDLNPRQGVWPALLYQQSLTLQLQILQYSILRSHKSVQYS